MLVFFPAHALIMRKNAVLYKTRWQRCDQGQDFNKAQPLISVDEQPRWQQQYENNLKS